MGELVLNDEQTKQLAGAVGPVTFKDAAGNVLGRLEPPLPPDFVAELKRRGVEPGPRYLAEQVLARLLALHTEWHRTHGFNQAYLDAFLAQLEQSDPEMYGPKRAA